MTDRYRATMLTPAVLAAQRHYYGRSRSAAAPAPGKDPLGPEEIAFVEARDSFYLATVTEAGWPYIQHRGGPAGFLRVLSPERLGFADFGGNRQMITIGSLSTNDRVSLFLMDYPAQARLKILGHARVVDARQDPEWVERVAPPGGHGAAVERVVLIDIVSFDWNCSQFITPRFTSSEVEQAVVPLRRRIEELEAAVSVNADRPG